MTPRESEGEEPLTARIAATENVTYRLRPGSRSAALGLATVGSSTRPGPGAKPSDRTSELSTMC